MPEFFNPFSGITHSSKMTDRELIRALRLNLAAEEEAVHLYEAYADATDNQLAKAVLQDITNEERVHAGEFQRLISILLDDEDKLLKEGADEVDEIAEDIRSKKSTAESGGDTAHKISTIGDLT